MCPTTSNTVSGFFRISGFYISCIANYDNARVDFCLSSGSSRKNKETFDLLPEHKAEIEARLGVSLIWDRAEDSKASRISYQLDNVSISNEANWPEMAEFQAEWSDKICGIMLEYLLSDEEKRLNAIAALFREWAQSRADVRLDTLRCSRAYCCCR